MDDDKRKPFHETGLFKAFVFTALPAVTAGVVVTGAPMARYYHHTQASPAYDLVTYDRADPYHSDPGGGFARIEPPETIGTASTFHLILGPGD